MMEIYITLATGPAHFATGKKKIEDQVHELNQRLAFLSTPTRVIDWYHSTANLVVRTPKQNRREVADELSLTLGIPCTALRVEEAQSYIAAAEKANTQPAEAGTQWTKGVAFLVKGRLLAVDPKPTPHATFRRINPFTVGVNRKERPKDQTGLEKDEAAGGWPAVAEDLANQFGGVWTARSLTATKSVVEKAHKHRQ